jgi:regulator of RNase E activity RraA
MHTFEPLTARDLESLRALNSPTVANALELLIPGSHGDGCLNPTIRCMFPEMGVMVGYACTASMISSTAPPKPRRVARSAYWEYLAAAPAPRIAVIADASEPPAGAFWGEVNSNIHKALGCVGTITNGTVRDLDEVRALGFHFFASSVSVSHVWAHLEDFGKPVRVGGVLIRPGDLLHADQHGAVVIPHHVARRVPEAAEQIARKERAVIGLCQSPQFSVAALRELLPDEY